MASDAQEKLLAMAARANNAAEVFATASERRHVEFESNRPKNIGQNQSSGIALRVIDGSGRIGFSSTSDDAKIEDLVSRVGALSEYGPVAKFEFPGSTAYPEVECFDAKVLELSDDDMLDMGRSAIDRILSEYPDALCSADFNKVVGEQTLINTSGVNATYTQTNSGFYLGVELIRDTDMLSIWDGMFSASATGEDAVNLVVDKILRRLEMSQRIVDAPSGKDLAVVFTPVGFVGTMLPPLLSGFNGKNVASGSSPLIDRWGEKMLDERLVIADDPLHPLTPQAHPVDDEGVPSRRIDIVNFGAIGEPIFDLQTAGEMETASTGCGLRDVSSTPSPSTSFITMDGGETTAHDIFDGIDSGILVEQLLGAGQGNQLGGDFRANLSLGFLIENGEVVGRVKDTMISGNVYEALNLVEAISDEPELVYGTRMVPWVRCRGVEVATSPS